MIMVSEFQKLIKYLSLIIFCLCSYSCDVNESSTNDSKKTGNSEINQASEGVNAGNSGDEDVNRVVNAGNPGDEDVNRVVNVGNPGDDDTNRAVNVGNPGDAFVSLYIQDAPLHKAKEFYVRVKGVKFYLEPQYQNSEDVGHVKVNLLTTATINLLKFDQVDSRLILREAPIPEGTYKEMRLILDAGNPSWVIDWDDNKLPVAVISSDYYTGTSGAQKVLSSNHTDPEFAFTGLNMVVKAGQKSVFTADIDLRNLLISAEDFYEGQAGKINTNKKSFLDKYLNKFGLQNAAYLLQGVAKQMALFGKKDVGQLSGEVSLAVDAIFACIHNDASIRSLANGINHLYSDPDCVTGSFSGIPVREGKFSTTLFPGKYRIAFTNMNTTDDPLGEDVYVYNKEFEIIKEQTTNLIINNQNVETETAKD